MKVLSLFILTSLGASHALGAPPASSPASGTTSLSLEQYLAEVREGHQAVQASIRSSRGALGRSEEADLVTSPNLFADIRWADDQKRNPLFGLNRSQTQSYSLGVSQQTGFGLQAKLSYTYANTDLSTAIQSGGYYEARPQLELTQSLWRNGFGSETRATQDLLEAGALATHFAQSFSVKAQLAEAEIAYWALSLTRENVAIQKEALDRAQRIFDWSANRARLQLGDRADTLQAQAALELARLDYQAAQDAARAAARTFNNARGIDTDKVEETVARLDAKMIDQLKAPERAGVRDDVKAAEQQQRASIANAKLSTEKLSPSLDVNALVALNGVTPDSGTAVSESFTTENPTMAVGLRFTAPLDFGSVSRSRAGWRDERAAAELNYQRRVFDQDQEWSELQHRLVEAKKRFELTRELEATQEKKLSYERDRLNRGRTTTFQVLQFEQDYARTQLARLQAQATVLQLIARMKTFGGSL